MAKESQHKLFDALKAHIANLEAERNRAFGQNQAVLEQRLEAAVKVLEWLSTRLADEQYQSAPPLRRSGSYSLSHQ
jgi:hypothetical protein